jgi:hypothetical protein
MEPAPSAASEAVYLALVFPDHPFLGQPHPWNDPLVPGGPFLSRPDWALQQFGPVPPPRPEEFPFTEAGRAAYYQAVEQAAMQSQMMMQQHMAHAAMRQQQMISTAEAHEQAVLRRRANLLLLL